MIQSTFTKVLTGALTSKPFAFAARPWELVVVPSVDTYDSFLGSVRLDFRGNDLLRVLPIINEELNEEWLTDKSRFSYDGLKKQRLLHPYVNTHTLVRLNGSSAEGSFSRILGGTGQRLKKVSFKDFRLLFSKALNDTNKRAVDVFLGKECDLETAVSLDAPLRSMFKKVTYRNSDSFNFSPFECHHLPRFKLNQHELLNSKILIFIGCNLRWESPLLNLKILRNVVSGHVLKVYGVACRPVLNYSFFNVGSNLNVFAKKFLTGRLSLLKQLLASANNVQPFFLFGYSCLSRFPKLFSALFNQQKIKFKQAILFPWASTLGLLEVLPAGDRAESFFENASVSISLGSDCSVDSHKRQLSLGVFSHGHDNQKLLDFLYPSSSYGELCSHFLNLFGVQRYARFGFTANTHVAPPWASIPDLFVPFGLNKISLLNTLSSGKFLFKSVCPTSFDEDYMRNVVFYYPDTGKQTLNMLANFYEVVPCYYRTHFAVRASKPMVLASARFQLSLGNFYNKS